MHEDSKRAILEKIKAYSRIIITRHVRPDGDAVGSTKGLQAILRLTYPEKEILLQNEDFSDYLAFLGAEDAPIADELYRDALLIVLDTATLDRISNSKASLAKEIVKIDHHIDVKPYGDLSLVEEERSSACEMVADFYLTLRDELKINAEAATYLYTGMVTDSGRFKFSASGDTLRCAAALLDCGIDTETLFSHLYLQDFDYLKFQAAIYKYMKITENGVAYLTVSLRMQKAFHMSPEQASNVISFMDGIKGSLIWLAFIENKDKSVRVRLRSRFVTVNTLAERYHGGGHACASGATVYSGKEKNALLQEADERLRDYKATHDGWL